MGQHTWFYRDKKIYDECASMHDTLDKVETGELLMPDNEYQEMNAKVEELSDTNKTDYHDLFRTWKREPSGEYTHDVIYSKEQCMSWLKENYDNVGKVNINMLNKFWEEFPDGVIDFG